MHRYGLRSALLGAVVLLAGCLGPDTRSALTQTLDGWRALGMTCGAPREDSVPNDLVQLTCRITADGVPMTVVLDGNAGGVFNLVAQVPGTTDRAAAGEVFATLAEATPVLADQDGAIAAWIRAEITKGTRTSTSLEGDSVTLERDASWITLVAFPELHRELSGSTT
jgi:hypothetical protein